MLRPAHEQRVGLERTIIRIGRQLVARVELQVQRPVRVRVEGADRQIHGQQMPPQLGSVAGAGGSSRRISDASERTDTIPGLLMMASSSCSQSIDFRS